MSRGSLPRQTWTVLLVEDEAAAIQSFMHAMSSHPDFRILRCASTCLDAIQAIDVLAPDLVVLDQGLPDHPGTSVASHAQDKEAAVIFITAADLSARQVYDLGVLDYLGKPLDPHRLAAALDRFRKQEHSPMPSSNAAPTLESILRETYACTSTEIAVCQCLHKGLDRDGTARHLQITRGTLKLHLNHVYAKLGIDGSGSSSANSTAKLARLVCKLFRLQGHP